MLRDCLVFIALECLVVLQAALAHNDRFLTVTEMHQRGVAQGLPFVWHFGMWGDAFIISGVVALIVGRYADQWNWRSILLACAIAVLVTGIVNLVFTLSATPQAHYQNHQVTAAGLIHLSYMSAALLVFILFFFCTHNISIFLLRTISVLLMMQLFLGTHIVLGAINTVASFDWYPDEPLKSAIGWLIIGGAAIGLMWRSNAFDDKPT